LQGFGLNLTYTTKTIGLEIDDKRRRHANYGVWRSAQNGALFGVVLAVCVFPIAIVAAMFIRWSMSLLPLSLSTPRMSLDSDWINWQYLLWVSISAGLWFGRALGGRAVVRHCILRVSLWGFGVFPLRLVAFLDHCVDRIFLRRIGGYIFVHRLLMEYFASLHKQSPEG
jgi:hypothetical protein